MTQEEFICLAVSVVARKLAPLAKTPLIFQLDFHGLHTAGVSIQEPGTPVTEWELFIKCVDPNVADLYVSSALLGKDFLVGYVTLKQPPIRAAHELAGWAANCYEYWLSLQDTLPKQDAV